MREAIEFFSGRFAAGDWTTVNVDLPEDDETGELAAYWVFEGYGVEVTTELTGFGTLSTGNVSGMMTVR